ncbi:MAG: efflux RND transporter periplasmic adaptor subunit, partial [Chloroflexota bacterium]
QGRLNSARNSIFNLGTGSQVVEAFVGDLTSGVSATGRLQPQREATVSIALSGRVVQVPVSPGEHVEEGDVLLVLDTEELQRAVDTAKQNLVIQEANLAELLAGATAEEIAASKASLESAQAQLDDLLAGPTDEELAQAEAAVASARSNLRAAEARFAAKDNQLLVAQANVNKAEKRRDDAQWAYDRVASDWITADSAPYSDQAEALHDATVDLETAKAQYNLTVLDINDTGLRSAQSQLAQAEASLALLSNPKQSQIASAKAQVAQAEASYTSLQAGATAERVQIAQAQVQQAQISLETAQSNLSNVTLVAPFSGVVTAVHFTEGEHASGPAVEIADPNSIQVVLEVDEVDIGTIAVDQAAIIRLEAWPEEELEGKVTSIAPRAKIAEVVTFEVHLSLDAGDLPLLSGMTANTELVTAKREDVLLVPNRAVISDRAAGTYSVNLMDGDTIKQVPVTIGLRDGDYTEITSGLSEGDRIFVGDPDSFAEEHPNGMGFMRIGQGR